MFDGIESPPSNPDENLTEALAVNDSLMFVYNSDPEKGIPIETGTRAMEFDYSLLEVENIPVNIIIKQNPYGKRYLTFNGNDRECTLEAATNGDNQKFFIKSCGAYGVFDIIPYQNSSYALYQVGKNGNLYLYATKHFSHPFGVVDIAWIINRGSSEATSYVFRNAQTIENLPSGNPYPWMQPDWVSFPGSTLGVNTNNGKLFFSDYTTGNRTQEFEVRPCDDFEVIQMTLHESGANAITDMPEFVIKESYINNSSTTQTTSTKITKRAQKTSTFNRKTSLSTSISTKSKISFLGMAGTELSVMIGETEEWAWGGQETIADDREYNFPLTIAPYKEIRVTIMVSREKANLNYIAKLRGINTGALIQEEGTWENVDCTDIVIALDEYDLTTGQRTGRTMTIYGVPTSSVSVSSWPTYIDKDKLTNFDKITDYNRPFVSSEANQNNSIKESITAPKQ